MSDTLFEETEEALAAIRARDDREPTVALVLGSGLGAYADTLEDRTVISYADIPGFQQSTVSGHSGELVIGSVAGLTVAVMKGRVHLYEGHGVKAVTFPLRVLRRAGATHLVITNAAGGVNPDYVPGDLVALTDHLNLTGQNPLFGPNDDRFGVRFPDMSEPYDAELRRIAFKVAGAKGISLKSGIYAGLNGPSYETPAEVRMIGKLGGDLVGMSTVCEVIVANHMGMRVLGVSCVSNLAAGLSGQPLTHDEVTETADRVRATFQGLIDGFLRHLAGQDRTEVSG